VIAVIEVCSHTLRIFTPRFSLCSKCQITTNNLPLWLIGCKHFRISLQSTEVQMPQVTSVIESTEYKGVISYEIEYEQN